MEKVLKEGKLNPLYDLKSAIPTEQDFKEFDDFRYATQRKKISWHEVAERIKDIKDQYLIIKYLVLASMYKWDYVRDLILKQTLALGYDYSEISTVLHYIKQNEAAYKSFYDTYVVKTAPTAGFWRIVAYDPKYNPPVRRHIYLRKKLPSGEYKVSIGGSTVTSWYEEPFFATEAQAQDFIKALPKVQTINDVTTFNYNVTSKPIDLGTSNGKKYEISDLTDCALVNTQCGPAYISKRCKYFAEGLTEEVEIEEAIEKHEELNPALFNEDATLKTEVKDKINEIVNEFLKDFIEVEVELKVKDIILTGSNASYNYTKDSDLDIHIIADTSEIENTLNLHKVIYNAYKSAFNKKFDIELNSVTVEVYVETQDTPLVSNGIYSVMNDAWVKEPTKESIPEVDQEAIDKAFKPWEKRYKTLLADTTEEVEDESDIDRFIDSLYELRAEGLSTDGEYSIENLVFKEMRNKGYLDNLKELRHKVIARRLSLHESLENFSDYLNVLNNLF